VAGDRPRTVAVRGNLVNREAAMKLAVVPSGRRGRSLGALVIAVLIGGGAVLALWHSPEGAGAAPGDPLADIGPFRLGVASGTERAAFTGAPFVYVFLDRSDSDLARASAALADPEVAQLMRGFTGVLLDAADEAARDTEPELRSQGLRVVVRALSGKFLGGIETPFGAEDLKTLLASVLRRHPHAAARSPLYSLLRTVPDAIARVVEAEGPEKAAWYVDLMAEAEGPESEAVVALRERIAR
jgi:hypothetical protein